MRVARCSLSFLFLAHRNDPWCVLLPNEAHLPQGSNWFAILFFCPPQFERVVITSYWILPARLFISDHISHQQVISWYKSAPVKLLTECLLLYCLKMRDTAFGKTSIFSALCVGFHMLQIGISACFSVTSVTTIEVYDFTPCIISF